uniref:Peptidase C19 ubiquitin carboxyl-terminal hydrolase domain-containing protein n=2 Tax=Lactuca sativa TaxID=4236 RepID=A0A9R1W2Q9_LACSA|nr:hypothetical protein LSAT_V11C300140130 [Lactuca sativa]
MKTKKKRLRHLQHQINGKYLSPDADKCVWNLYNLHSVLVNNGGVHGGHYYAFIRPTLPDKCYPGFNNAPFKIYKILERIHACLHT